MKPHERRRMAIWQHNGLQGHLRMARENVKAVMVNPNVTPEALALADEIFAKLVTLQTLAKERVNDAKESY